MLFANESKFACLAHFELLCWCLALMAQQPSRARSPGRTEMNIYGLKR